jgi:hypothetical protein
VDTLWIKLLLNAVVGGPFYVAIVAFLLWGRGSSPALTDWFGKMTPHAATPLSLKTGKEEIHPITTTTFFTDLDRAGIPFESRKSGTAKHIPLRGSSNALAVAQLKEEIEGKFRQDRIKREHQMQEERQRENDQKHPSSALLRNRILNHAEIAKEDEEKLQLVRQKLAKIPEAEWAAMSPHKREYLQTLLPGYIEADPLSAYRDAVHAGPKVAWEFIENQTGALNSFRIPTRSVGALAGRIISRLLNPR